MRGHNMRNLPGLHKCRIAVLRVMRVGMRLWMRLWMLVWMLVCMTVQMAVVIRVAIVTRCLSESRVLTLSSC